MDVMIGTPAYDFKLHALYVDSLLKTQLLCATRGVEIAHLFLCGDALIQRARNDIIKIFLESSQVQKLVFIDNDMFWNPEDFLKLISYEEDIIGAACIKKNPEVIDYNVSIIDKNIQEDGLLKVNGVGTGFLSISRYAAQKIYDSSPKYFDLQKRQENAMFFDVGVIENELYSEDMMFCHKWRNAGGKIWVDTNITIGHTGNTTNYVGNLNKFIKNTKDANDTKN